MAGIYIIRHGQTAWNKELVFRGRVDIPLNDHGFKEAEAVAEALKDRNIKFAYASPLSRAVQTAEPAAKHFGVEVVHEEEFIDMNFGKWEGRKLEAVKEEDPERFKVWVESPHELAIPDGETLPQVQERAMKALREVADRHPEDTGIVVSHRVVCKLLVLGLMGLGPDRFWNLQQDTACINFFKVDGARAITFGVNDTCHLQTIEGRVTADF